MSPIYPFAFAALTFAFLGTPRTTRQSRNFSIGSSILAVFGAAHGRLRLFGHGGEDRRWRALVQYLMLLAAISTWACGSSSRGIVIEPPAALMEAINNRTPDCCGCFGRPATA